MHLPPVLKKWVLALVMSLAVAGSYASVSAGASSSATAYTGIGAFDVQGFLDRQPGVLKSYTDGRYRAAQVIGGYGIYYSLDPRILLTLLELEPHLLTNPAPTTATLLQPFGNLGPSGFTAQIDWAAREIRAGFGPYTTAPDVRFADGSSATLPWNQDPSLIAVQRFLAEGHTQSEWSSLKDQYPALFRQFFGAEPETVTPVARPAAALPFLTLPWAAVYPTVPGDPLAGRPVRMIHSSYFDHVYPTVDRGPDGNDFVVTYLNRGNVSYNSHDGHDYYFPDRPIGTPIVAAADGIAYALTARGNGVVIRHSGANAGYETVYWHLDAFDQKFAGRIDTQIGVPVRAGDYLGVSGKSGFTDGGAHLHFEVRHNGKEVDPYGWFGPGSDPCAAWTAGCEASVWLWADNLRGSYDFTPPDAPAAPDREPPLGTLSVVTNPDLSLLVHFDDRPVPSIGVGAPTIDSQQATSGGVDLPYEDGVFGRALRVAPNAAVSYPISGNLSLRSGALSLWAKLPAHYAQNGTGRSYLFAASNNPGDSAHAIYTGTLALRREENGGTPRWNFWTVDDAGLRQDLVVTDTLQPGWHNFVATWKSADAGKPGEKRLYIDGTPVAAASGITLPTFAGEKLEIGRWTEGYGELEAAFDELAVFRRPLEAAEVRALSERRDFHSGEQGPLGEAGAIGTRDVLLDTNAIDRQGGVVAVRLRRDGEPWGAPLPYYDSYRWAISGTTGLHTFAVEYRDRSNNATVVTTTLTLGTAPTATAELVSSSDVSATLRLSAPSGQTLKVQLSARSDFAGAEWQPLQPEVTWVWPPEQPRILYVRFQSLPGLAGPALLFGPDTKRLYLPLMQKQ